MSLTLELPKAVESRLAARAARAGQTVEQTAAALLADAVAADDRTFAEVCEPIRQAFEQSGMTEDELDALVEEARQEIWEEQQRAKRS